MTTIILGIAVLVQGIVISRLIKRVERLEHAAVNVDNCSGERIRTAALTDFNK